MEGLTWKELVLGVLLPLMLGGYTYTWAGLRALGARIQDAEDKILVRLNMLDSGVLARVHERLEDLAHVEGRLQTFDINHIRHLKERVTRLEERSGDATIKPA